MKPILALLLAASFAAVHSFSWAKTPDSPATGKTRLGATLKGAKLGRDWKRR